jgi:hypothetical protein
MAQQLYKGGKTSKVFYVPKNIADAVPDGAFFEPEFTSDGILYRFVGFEEPEQPLLQPPEWAKDGACT